MTILKLFSELVKRLFENISSIFEGCYIFIESTIFGFFVGLSWAINEIVDSWSVPLTHKYKDTLYDK